MIGRKYKHVPTGTIWDFKESIIVSNKQGYSFTTKYDGKTHSWDMSLKTFYEMQEKDEFIKQ